MGLFNRVHIGKGVLLPETYVLVIIDGYIKDLCVDS